MIEIEINPNQIMLKPNFKQTYWAYFSLSSFFHWPVHVRVLVIPNVKSSKLFNPKINQEKKNLPTFSTLIIIYIYISIHTRVHAGKRSIEELIIRMECKKIPSFDLTLTYYLDRRKNKNNFNTQITNWQCYAANLWIGSPIQRHFP